MLEKKSMYLDELMPLIKEQLSGGSSVRIHPRGTSMLPLIREGKDSVVLSALPEKLKKYDIVLYQRKSGQYVLHRLVEVGDEYAFLGDNQFDIEKGIARDQLIARVSSFYREEKRVSVEKASYKFYCRAWYHSRNLRRFLRRIFTWMRKKDTNA